MEGPKSYHTDMFNHVRMEGRGDHLRLTLYTPFLEAEQHLHGVSPHDRFLIGIPSKLFFDIIKLLPPSDPTFEISDKFEISSGKIRSKLPYLREDVYPDILPDLACDITEIPFQAVELSKLFSDLGRVAFVSSPRHERPFARGAIVRPKTLIATDGSSRISAYPNEIIPVSTSILLPTESLSRGFRYFQGNPPGGGVFVMTNEAGAATDLLIKGAFPMFLKLRLGAGTLPFLEKSFPSGNFSTVELPRLQILLALGRAITIADPSFPRGTLEIFGDVATVEARFHDNYHREEILVEGGEQKLIFSLNLRSLAGILSRIDSEKAILRYYGAREPIVITDSKVRHFNAIQPIIA
jgi:DNA polymerase III sliding clamp (beta) subunit (PCNA family)